MTMPSLQTLLRLSRNPNYKLSKKELDQLENHRNEQFKEKHQNKNIRHTTSFRKHDTKIPSEDEVRKKEE